MNSFEKLSLLLETRLKQSQNSSKNNGKHHRHLDWSSDDEEDKFETYQREPTANNVIDPQNMSQFRFNIVPAPIFSASIRSLHFENFQVRHLFSKLKIVSRIVSKLLEELRISVMQLSSSSDDDDDVEDQDGQKINDNYNFNAKDWKKSIMIGGFLPPIAIFRTSLVVPAYVPGLPPKTELPEHCFLEVQIVDGGDNNNNEKQQQPHQQESPSSSLCMKKNKILVANLTALVVFVCCRVGLSSVSLLEAIVKSCLKNWFCVRNSSSELVFVQPEFKDVIFTVATNSMSADQRQQEEHAATKAMHHPVMSPLRKEKIAREFQEQNGKEFQVLSSDNADAFNKAIRIIVDEFLRDEKNQDDDNNNNSSNVLMEESILSFVASSYASFFARSHSHNVRKFVSRNDAERVGAFGKFFQLSEAREALRFFSTLIEKELLAESTNNSIHIDLFDTYVAAALVSIAKAGTKGSYVAQLPKSPFFALPPVTRRKVIKNASKKCNTFGQADSIFPNPARKKNELVMFDQRDEDDDQNGDNRQGNTKHRKLVGSAINDSNYYAPSLYDLILNCLMEKNPQLRSQRLKMELLFGEDLVPFSNNNDNVSIGDPSKNGESSNSKFATSSSSSMCCYYTIPPSLRLSVWAALVGIDELELDADEKIRDEAKIVSFSASSCDRQVLLDLPRCHPSDPLMKTPNGQLSTQRIVRLWLHYATKDEKITAWHNEEKNHVAEKKKQRNEQNDHLHPHHQNQNQNQHHIHYWQGIDSMAATMLSAGKNELLCAKVLQKIIENFVPDFAASNAIRARVGRLAGIVRFHDPFAAAHLDDACGVQIDHFALPWILTAFAHVFPLAQTCRLWDALLLHQEPVTLLVNFSVAVIVASRLKFLNAPDLASSLLLLRQSAQNVVYLASPVASQMESPELRNDGRNRSQSPKSNNNYNNQQQQHDSGKPTTVSFAKVLFSARKFAAVSPPFYQEWDDLENENCFDSMKRNDDKIKSRLSNKNRGTVGESDEDDDEQETISPLDHEELPIKRHVASVKIRDIENYDSCRWNNVIIVHVIKKGSEKVREEILSNNGSNSVDSELEKNLSFVVGPRVPFLVGKNEDFSQSQSVSAIRSHIKKHMIEAAVSSPTKDPSLMVQQILKKSYALDVTSPTKNINNVAESNGDHVQHSSTSTAVANRHVVVVASKNKNYAIDVALHLAGEGIEHVATLDL